jgi:hypothetical protein
MAQQVSMDDLAKLIGTKEIELNLLRTENLRLQAELELSKNGHEPGSEEPS